MYSKINKLITELNLAKIRRVNSFEIEYSLNRLIFLNKLYEYGFIRGFYLNNNYYITVLMKYVNNNVNFSKIYYIKGKRNINLLNLTKMTNRIKPCLYLLSTSKGYLFSDECFLYNISGIVVARIDL